MEYRNSAGRRHRPGLPRVLRERCSPGNASSGSTAAADNRTPEQNRLIELERENARLKMEVDVLKQAALIFARK